MKLLKRRIGILVGLIAFVVLVVAMTGWMPPNITEIRTIIEHEGRLAPLFFLALYILVVVTFLPATPVSLLSGVLFGPYWGTLWVVIGASIGATLAFNLARYVGGSYVTRLIQRHAGKLTSYNDAIARHGFSTTLILRLIPLVPFNILNFVLGVTKVKQKDYILATVLGIIPGSFVFAYAGATAADPSLRDILIVGVLFTALTLVGKYYQKRMNTS